MNGSRATEPRSVPAGLISASLAGAAAAATIITIVASSDHVRAVLPFCLVGAAVFLGGLAVGVERLVGLATAPILSGALIEMVLAEEPARARAVVLGCLWYAAVELGWDSIERRSVGRRARAVAVVRIHEVASVLAISLAASTIGLAAARFAPERSLLLRAAVVVIVLATLFAAARHLAQGAPTDEPVG